MRGRIMKWVTLNVLFSLLSSCGVTKYYIVRHAEKEVAAVMMASDVPLSERGRQRAEALKDRLRDEGITRIFSTNYIRTRATAQPLSTATGVRIELYDAVDSIVPKLRKHTGGAALIVGHSNTVDDLVNGLTSKTLLQDLPDTQYGDLFVVTKRGRRYSYLTTHFGL